MGLRHEYYIYSMGYFRALIAMTLYVNLPKDVVRVKESGRRATSFTTYLAQDVRQSAKIYREERLRLANIRRRPEKTLFGGYLGRELALKRGHIDFVQSLLGEIAKAENTAQEVLEGKEGASKHKVGQVVANRQREMVQYLRCCL